MHVVTHPEVHIQPHVPVTGWSLSAAGRRRAAGLLELPWASDVAHVFTSAERKAVQTAEVLITCAGSRRQPVVDIDLGENDRSATGFLPAEEFEAVADQFFATPAASIRGWETAFHAQGRIRAAVERCLTQAKDGDVAVVCHGLVGTLLWCQLANKQIDRAHDQPGQGSWYSVDLDSMRPLTTWRRIPMPAKNGCQQIPEQAAGGSA